MHLGTYIYTWIYGNLVGSDNSNNKYYCNSKNFDDPDAKRWVIFFKEIEPSLIPPHWHAWLHKTINTPPYKYQHKYKWQKDHEKNMTGTKNAYYPSSHPLSKITEESKEEYEAWKP